MNLANFLKQADEITAQYTAAQLNLFIHDIGRVLPEECREDFLMRLKASGEETSKVVHKEVVNDKKSQKTYLRIRDNLKKIDSQEVIIEPLAVIEAKRTCVDVSKGRQQAKL